MDAVHLSAGSCGSAEMVIVGGSMKVKTVWATLGVRRVARSGRATEAAAIPKLPSSPLPFGSVAAVNGAESDRAEGNLACVQQGVRR